jgi:hypothetical protein
MAELAQICQMFCSGCWSPELASHDKGLRLGRPPAPHH